MLVAEYQDVYQLVKTSDLYMPSLEAAHYGGLHFRYGPAILCDTSHKYIIGPQVFQVQGSMLVNAFNTHIPPPPSSEHFSSVFSQWCRIKLRRQHRGGLSFLGFLGPTSKTRRLELGNSEQLESLFNYVCGYQACHQCVPPPPEFKP